MVALMLPQEAIAVSPHSQPQHAVPQPQPHQLQEQDASVVHTLLQFLLAQLALQTLTLLFLEHVLPTWPDAQ